MKNIPHLIGEKKRCLGDQIYEELMDVKFKYKFCHGCGRMYR